MALSAVCFGLNINISLSKALIKPKSATRILLQVADLSVGGPDRAWTYDLQIMRTIRWRFVIARLTNLNWIAVSYKIHYPLWDSLNTPNWNRLFTHCLRRIGCIKTVIRPIGNNARSLFCFAQVLLLSQIICVFATKKWSVTLNIDNKSTLTFSTPT